jgi:hypothetical protein
MISNTGSNAQPQASSLPDPKGGTAPDVALLDPSTPIEVASTGNGTTIDPSATGKPPNVYGNDLDLLG